MRVIAGRARGHPLIAPKGTDTRPITAKIKAALFNSWQMRLPNCCFLDLFAGSGSMGIEAMSRGAKKVVFVEKDPKAIRVIRKNIAVCKFADGYEIYQEDVFRSIDRLNNLSYRFDIIYLDPPFTVDGIFLPAMKALSDGDLLFEDGIIAIRTRREREMPDALGNLMKIKQKVYGISCVHIYQIAEPSP